MAEVAAIEGAFTGVEFHPGLVAFMRDGTRLVADVYAPTGEGPFPVLLMRLPYGRASASTAVHAHPAWFARRGYIVAVQDVRGRGDSGGEFYPFRHEGADGFDSVRWAAQLPKSSGRVGLYGFSYGGDTAVMAALSRAPALKAIAPHMCAFDAYGGGFYRDGILDLALTMAWGARLLRDDARRRSTASRDKIEAVARTPGVLSHAFPLAGAAPVTNDDLPRYVRDWLAHHTRDAYWAEFDQREAAAALDLPMFHLTGWYDPYQRGAMEAWRLRQARGTDFLLAGPWVHYPWGTRIGAMECGPAARPDIDELLVRFFDAHLKPGASATLPRGVRYFVLGENDWRTAPAWPPPEAREVEWHLASGGRANSRFGDGVLQREGAAGPEDVFVYDPDKPVAAPNGDHGGMTTWGPANLAPQQQGNDLLVFTSAPLSERVVVAGAARCELHVASTAPATDFVVRLSRVPAGAPDMAVFLALGAAQLREGAERVDGAARVTVLLDDVAASFAVGDRLRIDLASSAFPLLARNPNTGTPHTRVRSPADFRAATNLVYHDSLRPSRLVLPVIAG